MEKPEEGKDAASRSSLDSTTVQQPPAVVTDPEKTTPTPAPAGPDPNDFPDGGLQAWLVVLGGFCTVFASFGWINCIGIFQAYYEAHQLSEYSSSTVAWIPSTESFFMFFCVGVPHHDMWTID